MKKFIAVLLTAILAAGVLSACGSSQTASPAGSAAADTAASADTASAAESAGGTSEPLHIVTTIFPEYDWVMNILGDNAGQAEVTMLLDNGVDLHSYQPTAEDILNISTCDVFIYVGGESDAWVNDALKQKVNQDMQVLNLLEILGDAVKEEEIVEGMEHEHDHDEEADEHDEDVDEHDEADDHDHDHEDAELDEHVWLSLRNAQVLVDAIAQALEQADPANAETYAANAAAYTEKITALDAAYQEAAEGAARKTVLFGDRFPFRYMTDDYGLDYYAAFVGCSAETEASFETVMFLAGKVDELSLPAVITIEGTDHRLAETIIQNTKSKDQKILTVDSMQAVTSQALESGVSYLSIMENNLEVLKEALQ